MSDVSKFGVPGEGKGVLQPLSKRTQAEREREEAWFALRGTVSWMLEGWPKVDEELKRMYEFISDNPVNDLYTISLVTYLRGTYDNRDKLVWWDQLLAASQKLATDRGEDVKELFKYIDGASD
jgi:hypothetical protein